MNEAEILAAAVGLLSPRSFFSGLSGLGGRRGNVSGLSGIARAFQEKGLGNVFCSWVGKGENLPITASQVADVLGRKTLVAFAARARVGVGEASSVLASVLPELVDRMTPEGRLPGKGALEKIVESVLSTGRMNKGEHSWHTRNYFAC
jgi:uncharacterized protein YidB (DUF937 family)